MIEVRELDDAELGDVNGGVISNCDMLLAQIYETAAIGLDGMGQRLQGANFHSMATDAMMNQGCHGK